MILTSFINEAIRLRQALESVRGSEVRLREIIDNSPSLISLNDLQNRYLVVNRRFEAWHGRTAREVMGRRPDEVFLPDVARLYAPRSATALHDCSIVERETEVVLQDGSAHTVLVTRFPIRDTHDRPIGIGTIATDVTERRRAEERLRHKQQLEALGQLTGGVAHDFNNLLAVIVGNLDLLRGRFYEHDANRELIDDSLSSASSGRELVQRLLAFGRRQRLQPEFADANKIVTGLSRGLKRMLGDAIRIRWHLNEDLWPSIVDRGQFETSLLNLAFNARDAMPRGGLLTIETRNMVLREPAAKHETHETIAPGSYVMVTVTDNGLGMTPIVAAQAFRPFFTTKEPGKGNGLGLSMVYGFVKQSGGYLTLESKPGEGTSVKLYLPRAKDDYVRAEEPNEHAVDLRVGGERILVVEDKSVVRRMTKALLASLGYVTLEAEDASTALALLQQPAHVHLLLTDILLTGQLQRFGSRERGAASAAGVEGAFHVGLCRSGFAGAGERRNRTAGHRQAIHQGRSRAQGATGARR